MAALGFERHDKGGLFGKSDRFMGGRPVALYSKMPNRCQMEQHKSRVSVMESGNSLTKLEKRRQERPRRAKIPWWSCHAVHNICVWCRFLLVARDNSI